ncbi:MAG: divisome protein SepX/GlpR [Jatrophihabitans sp.]|uniref:divisome protein SepX/GlpR n=1 Tax=Jatrophihabitans sp. TaxID=1932789 RepID=UPI003F7DA26B
MTVVVLTVLWLIVVVPMVVRRNDERRRERDVAGFGRAMRALGRRSTASPRRSGDRDVFVHRAADVARATAAVPDPSSDRPAATLAKPDRRPVPVAQEALMYPVDRSELSAARAQMMARRRRSLTVLVGGTVVFGILGLLAGGLTWLLFAPFALGLGGYLWFLRSQAIKDRARREARQARAARRRGPVGYDATDDPARLDTAPVSVVRIDDDDIELQSMDTMDLTGLYEAEEPTEAVQRRAS